MNRIQTYLLVIIILGGATNAGRVFSGDSPAQDQKKIDLRSYNLGVIGAFSEVVNLGIKKLALSSPLSPGDMADLLEDAERIAKKNGVSIYLEKDLLATDLFPEEVSRGQQVLLIYKGEVKKEYLALKAEKNELVRAGNYRGEARKEIGRKMGRLLSYPEEIIEQMLAQPK